MVRAGRLAPTHQGPAYFRQTILGGREKIASRGQKSRLRRPSYGARSRRPPRYGSGRCAGSNARCPGQQAKAQPGSRGKEQPVSRHNASTPGRQSVVETPLHGLLFGSTVPRFACASIGSGNLVATITLRHATARLSPMFSVPAKASEMTACPLSVGTIVWKGLLQRSPPVRSKPGVISSLGGDLVIEFQLQTRTRL